MGVKIADTTYEMESQGDFARLVDRKVKEMTGEASAERFSDKTQEEVEWELSRRKRLQFKHLVTTRKYQLGGLLGCVFFYVFVYRKYLHPKPVASTVSFSQAKQFLKNNNVVRRELGANFHFMCCNGFVYPYKQ